MRGLALAETLPIEIEPGRGLTRRTVRLSTEGKPLVFEPDQVEVAVTVEAAQIVKEYRAVEVQAKNSGGEYSINPKSVYLRLTGPGDELEKLEVGAGPGFPRSRRLGGGRAFAAVEREFAAGYQSAGAETATVQGAYREIKKIGSSGFPVEKCLAQCPAR